MSNICNCPKPPGGLVICENNQLALCIIENGEVIQRCMNPPQNQLYTTSDQALVNWALAVITNQYRNWNENIEHYELEILKNGNYQTAKFEITFTLTQKIISAIDELRNGSGNLTVT